MSRRVCDFDVVFEVAFAVVLPKTYLSFLAEQFAERPGAVKGAFCAAQRTLDGEDRSATLPLGKGRWTDMRYASCLIQRFFPKLLFALLLLLLLLSPHFHPHSR